MGRPPAGYCSVTHDVITIVKRLSTACPLRVNPPTRPPLCSLFTPAHCFLPMPLSTQTAGVMSVYLFMKRYTAEEMYRPHPGFYRPRLSNCSDYSGQFLHPDAWVRGRSPSDISSEASLQMNSNYPALLKCPDYDQMSSSPCWGPRPDHGGGKHTPRPKEWVTVGPQQPARLEPQKLPLAL